MNAFLAANALMDPAKAKGTLKLADESAAPDSNAETSAQLGANYSSASLFYSIKWGYQPGRFPREGDEDKKILAWGERSCLVHSNQYRTVLSLDRGATSTTHRRGLLRGARPGAGAHR